ncbi:MAG: hypothetical protein QXQ57_06495 [Sulfolobales archaeon]
MIDKQSSSGESIVKTARRKERYIDRWLREHPRVSLYLSRDEYN